MATLGELRADLRENKLVESSEDYFTPAFLLDMVRDASEELAAAFRFPKRTEAFTGEAASTSSLTIAETPLDVYEVSFNGVSARRASRASVEFFQALPDAAFPRVWFYDPMEGGDVVEVGPGNASSGDFLVEYLGPVYQSTPDENTDAWGGLFEAFQELITLRAAVKAFEMGYEYESSAHFFQRHNALLGEFARYLGMQAPQGMQAGGAS